MDDKIKHCCPNCSQLYYVLTLSPQLKGNIPLYLSCGHSMCENCIKNIVKFEEPIECKICHKDMEIEPSDLSKIKQNQIKLYQVFPVNNYMLGEVIVQVIENNEQKQPETEHFIDLKEIIKNTDNTKGECFECHKPTTKMCLQCASVICDSCFNKSHKNFIVFKSHILQDIDSSMLPNTCKAHSEKELNYYCKDCSKAICMDCMMVGGQKSCKNHNVESLQEVNESFIEELSEITPKVDETYRRLTKTAVDIGNILHNIANDTSPATELTQTLSNIEQHFSKLLSIIQKHKQEITSIIDQLKQTEKESLLKARENVANSLTQARKVLNVVKSTIDQEKIKKMNLCTILEEAKNVIESPWYLSHDENKDDTLKLVVNDDLCLLINDYIHLEGNARSSYKLKSTSQLGDTELPPPPIAPVYPPELPKDVRQQQSKPKKEKPNELTKPSTFLKEIPKYHVKAGSMTSLDSFDSNHSSQPGAKANYASYYKPAVQQVMPFAESKPPKLLVEGSQEVIYISHIVDPHNFFVQRACHQELVKEMLRDFRNAGSLPKPSSNHVTEGKLYLAFNKADNMWQRCRVVSIDRSDINKSLYTVFCIDFGSTEVVAIDKLRLLPPARVQYPFPLAINCALANCVPISGAWTSDDALLIQTIIDNKQAIIHVRNVVSMSNYMVKLNCDVFTYEDGASVAHALVFHERAKMLDARYTYAQIAGACEKPKLFVSNNDYKHRATDEVYITHIASPDKFYVRKQRVQSVYEKLCEDMEQEYSMVVNSGTVYLPEVGGLYAVNVQLQPGESGWCRGVVVQLPGRRRVRLQLCDTGNVLLVHYSALRKIHNKFTTLMALATECHLSGVTPLNKQWSQASVAFLQKFEGHVLELYVENDRNKNSIGVTLYEKSDLDNVICINKEMIKHKFAVSFGVFKFNRNEPVEEQPIIRKSPPTEQKPRPKPKTKLKILKRNEEVPQTSKSSDLDAKDKGPLRLEAKILCCKSPSLLYVSFIGLQKTCNELYEKIQKYYSKKAPEGKKNWAVGDRCVTKCRSSKTWRRADIIEINENEAKVFYSDFAVIENVPITDLMELAPEFASFGYAAVKCHLSGIMPAVGDKWPCLTIELLNELLDAYKRVFVTKCGNIKDQSMPIELWVYHTIQGGALEPDKSEWRCLNRKIVEEGLAIPDKSQGTAAGSKTSSGNSEDEILSFLNVHKSFQELLQLDSAPSKPVPEPSDPDNSIQTPECDESTSAIEKYTNTVLVSDWLPPEPFQSEEFTAIPTYIDNDGIIYLYSISQQDTQDLIRKALEARFEKVDPKSKHAKWTVGEPCIAKFFLDSKFYRGRVLSVNKENSSCLIHYIDYGNEEQCAFADLRKSIALYQIPTQAHRCVLARIKPARGHWDRLRLDYIHKFIVEKQCLIKIKGPAVDGVIPIDLTFDKLLINDHLVDFEMAIYIDGTKAAVPKFAPSVNKNNRSTVESDSGPEYIIEDDSDTIGPVSNSQDSFDIKYFEGKDWNEIIDEEQKMQEGNYVTFCEHLEPSFKATVNIINSIDSLELNKINDQKTTEDYDALFVTLQEESENQPQLNGVFENKACLARFSEDNQWYRASILEYSEAKNRIKVRYVDYGNIEVICFSDAREIKEEWTVLPPVTISVRIHGVKVNKDVEMEIIIQKYTETFLDREAFNVQVMEVIDKVPYVELRDFSEKLVYENLLNEGIFFKSDTTE